MEIGTIQKNGSAIAFAGLALLATSFVANALVRYLPLDPTRSMVELSPPIFPLLVLHVVFGGVAMLTVCLQAALARWPSIRERAPRLHRRAGRLYVFGGVLPAGLLALIVAWHSPFGPVARASNLVFALVWLAATLAGWRAIRRGDDAAHRRWMLRSGVLTLSILTNRVWGPVAWLILSPRLATTFHGDEQFLAWTIAGLSTWLGWTLPLLAVEAYLERSRTDRERTPSGIALTSARA